MSQLEASRQPDHTKIHMKNKNFFIITWKAAT